MLNGSYVARCHRLTHVDFTLLIWWKLVPRSKISSPHTCWFHLNSLKRLHCLKHVRFTFLINPFSKDEILSPHTCWESLIICLQQTGSPRLKLVESYLLFVCEHVKNGYFDRQVGLRPINEFYELEMGLRPTLNMYNFRVKTLSPPG